MRADNPAPAADQASILIIDDMVSNLGVVVGMLENRGYRVSVAQEGGEGLRRAELIRPGVILLDVMMPGMDGFEICRQLKCQDATRHIPVIFMTALASTEHKVKGFEVGGVDYITKPLQIDEVLARVGTHLQLHAAQTRLEQQNRQLDQYRRELEQRVEERTAELVASNRRLLEEIAERERTQERLALVDFALNRVCEAAFLVGEDGGFRYVNDEACRALAYDRETLLKMHVGDVDPNWPSASWPAFWQSLRRKGSILLETEHLAGDGRRFPVEVSANYFEYLGVGYNLGLVRDISERRRQAAQEETRRRIFEALAQGRELTDVLLLVIDYIQQVDPECLGSIMLLDEDGKRLHALASPSLPDDYTAALDGFAIGDGAGSCGTAVARGETVIVEDVRTHPYWAEFKDLAVGAGLLSCWSEPIFDSSGQVMGTLGFYHRRVGGPTDAQLALLKRASHFAAIAIERRRIETKLRASERKFRTLAENSPDLVGRYDSNCRYVYCNPQLQAILGRPLEGILGKQPVELVDFPFVRGYQDKIAEVLRTGLPTEWVAASPPISGVRKIHDHIRFVPEFDGGSQPVSVLAIGRDISQFKEIERQLRSLIENIPDFVVRLDSHGRYVYVSPIVLRALGVDEAYFLGKTAVEIGVTGDAGNDQALLDATLRCVSEGRANQIEIAFGAADAQKIYSVAHVPEFDEFGRIDTVLGVSRDITGLKLVNRALQKKEALLRSLIDSIPDLIFFKDLQSVYLGFNKAFAEFCGHGEAEMVGKSDYDFTSAEMADSFRQYDYQMLKQGRAQHNDEWVVYPDGRSVLLNTLKTPLYDENGDIIGIIGISRDITERHRMEQELVCRERELRTLAENSPDIIVRYDCAGRRVYANRAEAEIPFAEALSGGAKSAWRLVSPAREEFVERLRCVIADGEADELLLEVADRAGLPAYYTVSMVPEFDDGKRIVSVLVIGHDISGIKRMEAMLRKSELEFRTLAENSPEMIVRYDRECRRVYINPAYERETCIPLEKAWHKTPTEVWKPMMDAEDYMRCLQRVMASGRPERILLEWLDAEARLVSHDMHAVAEYDEDGQATGVLVIGHNVTDLKNTERRLEESRAQLRVLTAKREEAREEERKRVAREIHDELGQLLNVLRLNVTTLDFRFGDGNPALRDKTVKMVATVDRAIQMVRSLATRLRPAVLNAGIVSALEWLVQEYAESTGIACDLHLPGEDVPLDEDRAMVVFRIVQESLTNVLRHSEASRVDIVIRRDGDCCEVEIRDNGKGFDPDTAGRTNSYGIVGMRERALILKGTLDIFPAPAGGTVLKLRIPIHGESQ